MQNVANVANVSSTSRKQVFDPSNQLFSEIVNLPGLRAYYPLNEDSGNAINRAPATYGSFNGTVSGALQGQAGQVGKSYDLDGSDDFINCNSTAILPANTEACSIFAIIKSNNTDAIQNIIGNKRDSTTLGWHLKISTNNRLEFGFYTGSLFSEGTNRSWGDTEELGVADDTWVFVGVTFDGFTAKFYVDDTEFVRETLENQVNISENTAQNVRIGHRQAAGVGEEFFDGGIQHVGVTNTVLSTSQMLRLCQLRGFA